MSYIDFYDIPKKEKRFVFEEFQRPSDKIRVNRLSRHLYDIWKISQTSFKADALCLPLIKDIIAHRKRFSAMKGVDYDSLYPPTLNPIPPERFIKDWEIDYKKMQNSMIYGDSPSFSELIRDVITATAEYNAINMGT